MSSENQLSVHQSENVVFKDIDALNAALLKNHYTRELIESRVGPDPKRLIEIEFQNGGVVFFDRQDGTYRNGITVWGCWDETDSAKIAAHMASGKLVLRYQEEGGDDEYHVITPQGMTKPSLRF
jgi:hypothetical protein